MATPKQITKEREKENGEVFTPKFLIKEMLQKIDKEIWKDPQKTFLEPSAGDGNILVGIYHYRVKIFKIDPIKALDTLYGVDLMEDNVYDCRQRLLHKYVEYGGNDIKKAEEIVNRNMAICNTLEFHMWSKSLSKDEKGEYITYDKYYNHVDRTSEEITTKNIVEEISIPKKEG